MKVRVPGAHDLEAGHARQTCFLIDGVMAIDAPTGRCVAYSGDTDGDLLPMIQDELAPEVVFVDVTYPNRLQWRAEVSGHLTPSPLERQLGAALRNGVRLPRTVPVHLSLHDDDEIREELATVSSALGVDLTPGYEDMVL